MAEPVPDAVDVPAFPFARTDVLDLPPELARLRSEHPVSRVELWDGSRPWLVTGYRHARDVLGNRRFSSDPALPGFPVTAHERSGIGSERTLITMDPPEHTRHRRMLNGDFALPRVEDMRPEIEAIADHLLDAVLGSVPPVDLVEMFALPLPSLVICHLLGVPRADRPYFEDRSCLVVSSGTPREQVMAAYGELRAYVERLVAHKETTPGDDCVSRLVERERAGEITRPEVVDTVHLLLLAGHKTTANMIGLGALVLLEHPEQLAELRERPDELIDRAVEEVLRHLTLFQGLRRVATADVVIGDELIRAGEGVIVHIAAANRDHAFPDPERFDIHQGVRTHLSFGYGFHQCVGQLLARTELRIALKALLRLLPPTFALAVPPGLVPFSRDGFLHGVNSLPITW